MGENYSRNKRYLASFANKDLKLSPQGQVVSSRLRYEWPCTTNALLDKLKVSTHVFRVSTYKIRRQAFIATICRPPPPAGRQPLDRQRTVAELPAYRFRQSPDFAATTLPGAQAIIDGLTSVGGDTARKYALDRINWWTPSPPVQVKKR